MPAVSPYIPTKQADANLWLQNFSTLITATPSAFGLAPVDATNIAAAVAAWTAAYNLITSPTTKTKNAVQAKNTAFVTVMAIVRPYAQQISLNVGVTSANKIALGLNPKTSTPTPITAPQSNPVLTQISQNPGIWNFSYRDSQTSPSAKSKPFGVKMLVLVAMPSATPVTDVTVLPVAGHFTKSPSQFVLPTGYTKGATWYYSAYWMTQKGLKSPLSPIGTFVAS